MRGRRADVDVSILIISYNTRELTLACLESVYAQAGRRTLELIVVDNASADGSADAIAERFPDVRLMALDQNLGFAAANNLAAQQAGGEYLLLLNPDTVVLDGAVEKLLVFAEANPSCGVFGGRTLAPDGSLNPASCWRRPTPWSVACQALGLAALGRGTNWLNSEAMGGWRRDSVREVDIVSGCFLLIRAELWRELGGFDSAFFMYGEDADLCLRARRLGARCLICPDATIIHYAGASERVRADKMVRLFTAKRRLFEKYWRPGSATFGVMMLRVWTLTRMAAFAATSHITPKKYLDSYRTWGMIWAKRGEWARDSGDVAASCHGQAGSIVR